jgi:Predicted membrane protein
LIVPGKKNIAKGIRTVALFEAFKGIIILLAGFALLRLVHGELQLIADHIVRHLHMNPARHNPHIFLDAIAGLDDSKIKYLAAFAFLYSVVRFIEAYGLWHLKTWAEWFAIISGGIYIPIELIGLFKHATLIKGSIFVINLFIVLYLIYIQIIIRKSARELKNIQSEK